MSTTPESTPGTPGTPEQQVRWKRAVGAASGALGVVELSAQAAGVVVMVRPHVFTPNPETACDNAFQVPRPDLAERAVADQARGEFDAAVAELGRVGVVVHAFDDDGSR